ncbi:MAG TPA: tetratricopeptide repeat protein [Thermoanaerobaculia bacterium]|nr:tetratricopeptide repeat protein [Thermoanaerobaculia bacterium]
MIRKFLLAVAFSTAAAAAPRVAFVRTIAPLHNLGGSEVVIIYALGDAPKLDTFLDTFLDRTNRSEELRIETQLDHIKRLHGEWPDAVVVRRIRREHPADVYLGVNHFTCSTTQRGGEGSEHTTAGERIRRHHVWADAVCRGRMDVIDPATARRLFSFDVHGEGTSPRVTDVTEEERNIAAEQAAHFAAVQAAEMVTPRRIRESIELDARAPEMDRAMLLINAGRLAAARNVWKRALERAPDSAPLHYNIAAVSEAMGNVDVARDHYSAAVRLAPKERWYRLEAKMFERRSSGGR